MLKYHTSDYFNEQDTYLLFTGWRYALTKATSDGYATTGLQWKLTSVPTVNFNEIKGREVVRLFKSNTWPPNHLSSLKGVINQTLEGNPGNFGVNWHQAQDFKEYGFPYYWNDPNFLLLI